MIADFKDWSEWIKEGHFVSYLIEGVRYYEHVLYRDLAHYIYTWPELITSGTESGPFTPDYLEITRGYDSKANLNQMWQMIFGIKHQAYIYIELPTDIHRHGLPKIPKPSSAERKVSHFEEYMSPYLEPSFITEHIMMRQGLERITLDAYNPCPVSLQPQLNIFIAKLVTERVGTEDEGVLSTPVIPDNQKKTDRLARRWGETLDKLYKRQIPQRPLTLLPVRAPAEAPSGE